MNRLRAIIKEEIEYIFYRSDDSNEPPVESNMDYFYSDYEKVIENLLEIKEILNSKNYSDSEKFKKIKNYMKDKP